MQQQLAHPSRDFRRRTAPSLHRGRGLVSGRGQGRRQPARGQRHHDPREREALAWREKGQLVQPHRR